MLGTIVNALAIVVGGIVGIIFKNIIPDKLSESLLKAQGYPLSVAEECSLV